MSEALDNPAPPAPLPAHLDGPDPVRSERARRAAETRAAKRKAKEERQRRSAEKRSAKAARDEQLDDKRELDEQRKAQPSSDAPPPADGEHDAEWERWVREEMDRPLQGPEDLAELLGKIQMTLCGAAQGTAFEDAAWSLQWTNGKDPLRRAKMGSRMLWPWMKRHGYDGVKLAEQSEGILAAIGVLVLVGPSVRPAIDGMQKIRAAKSAAAAAATLAPKPDTETTPAEPH